MIKMILNAVLILSAYQAFAEAPAKGENVDKFVGEGVTLVKDIYEAERRNLRQGQVEKKIWTGAFWSIRNGSIGMRYADPAFPKKEWSENYNYIKAHPASVADRNQLSPAEKYDLLIGSSQFAMTAWAWNLGDKYMDQTGEVPAWMGNSHGLFAASQFHEEPLHPVTVIAADGLPLTFYPEDIKALLTQLWAMRSPPTHFVGSRCHTPNVVPPLPKCEDPNPATFHLAVINRMGLQKQSFILDLVHDEEVWNYPLHSYQYIYYNPDTGMETQNISKAMAEIHPYTAVPHHPDARYLIGIRMTIQFLNHTLPTHSSPTEAPTKSLIYDYELELDASHNIVGGYWQSEARPDFLWRTVDGMAPVAREELAAGLNAREWFAGEPIPQSWRAVAQKASVSGEPLRVILDQLLYLSR